MSQYCAWPRALTSNFGDSRGNVPVYFHSVRLGTGTYCDLGGDVPGVVLFFFGLLVCSRDSSGLGRSFFASRCSVFLVVHICGFFTILTDLDSDPIDFGTVK